MKQSVLHYLYISNNVESPQLTLCMLYHEAVLQMLHDDCGHQGLDNTLTLAREGFYWRTICKDVAEHITDCQGHQVTKDHCTGLHAQHV